MKKLAVLLVIFLGCPALPPGVPVVDPTPACSNLKALGCAEGISPSCVAVFQKAMAEQVTDLKPACLVAAKSKAEVRACGTVTCP